MNRRHFLARLGGVLCGSFRAASLAPCAAMSGAGPEHVTLFLCGDVMTGRGIDQILPHPGKPRLFEPWVQSAQTYVELAERATGPIRRPVDFAYVWGDALAAWERVRPDARLVNLETAVTASDTPWPDKGIHYRMHPANVAVLTTARIDCCVLANNHVLDWDYAGLRETLATLRRAGIGTVGAGCDQAEAAAPAFIVLPGKGRVVVFAYGMYSSGVPREWAAGGNLPGVNWLKDLSAESAAAIARQVRAVKLQGDVVVLSLHWGGNWGFAVPEEQRVFARRLIEEGGVDLVYGHSSHHVKGIEVYRGKAILYGCGDFLNDYEGIAGFEEYRGDLALMYFPTLDLASGRLMKLAMTPTQTRHFRVNRAPGEGVRWLEERLNREGRKLGTRVVRQPDDTLLLEWG